MKWYRPQAPRIIRVVELTLAELNRYHVRETYYMRDGEKNACSMMWREMVRRIGCIDPTGEV